MFKRSYLVVAFVFIAILTFSYGSPRKLEAMTIDSSDYEDLVNLFKEFREFVKPKVTNGVPDYTAAAMKEQRRGLKEFQSRLAAVAISGWPISQQVDYHIVRAEMNGLDFQHRVLQPWSRDPGFYGIIRVGNGPTLYGSLRRIPDLPLSPDGMAEFRMKLKAIPEIFKQAKGNLTKGVGDLAMLAIKKKEEENAIFLELEAQLASHHPDLVPDVKRALAAAEDFLDWLKENKDKMTEPVGVGKENFNWLLKNVYLLPYTWEECRTIAQREYKREMAFLKLEEHKNRKLPRFKLVTTEKEHRRRYNEAEQYLLKFLNEEEIYTIPEYLKPTGPDVVTPRWDGPERKGGIRGFFEQGEDRDPMQQIIHNFAGHHNDGLRFQRDNRPIRGIRSIFRVNTIRGEAMATGLEEMLMIAGLFDKRPRGREIVYIALAYRAVRALGDLKIHSNEFTVLDAVKHDSDMSPYGWALIDDYLIWEHMQSTCRRPGYEMSYTISKVRLEELLADRAYQLGDKFNIREFFDGFLAAGMIPMSLIRWEMTGLDDEIKKLW